MNERPKIVAPIQNILYHKEFDKTVESAQPHDVWNDPDLVPPPVVMLDQEEEYYE